MSEYGHFLRGLLDQPLAVSAPTPSSPALAKAIAAEVDPGRDGLVVELGPGTGVVTQALLERGIGPDRLLLIENNAYFYGLLAQRFAKVRVVRGDAAAFDFYLPKGSKIGSIVSGLPMLNFPQPMRRSLIERALYRQGSGGRFIQLSYGWSPAVAPTDKLRVEKKLVWRNLPPAHIWIYREN